MCERMLQRKATGGRNPLGARQWVRGKIVRDILSLPPEKTVLS